MTWTLPAEAWPTVAAMLELIAEPWPEGLARHDLAFLRWEVEAGHRPRVPGRGFLATRWGWTTHQARAFLEANPHRPGTPSSSTPGGRQVGSGTIHVAPGLSVPFTVPDASSAPAAPTDPLTRAFRGLGLAEPSPAHRQPTASPETVEPGLSPESRQPTASPAATSDAGGPPHTPPDLSRTDPDHHDQDRSQEGVQGEGAPMLPAALARRAQELPEARAFLVVWNRWRYHPKAPARWTGGPADALDWFLELLASPPDTSMGATLARLDVVAALEGWDAWLSDRVDEHGKPGTKGRSRFPRGWKNALRTWFTNQVKFGRNLRPEATRRRGAWAGRATTFAPTEPATTGPAPCTTTTEPLGDPDALDSF